MTSSSLAARRHPPDVLLGGPARAYERLTIAKRPGLPSPIDGSPGLGCGADQSRSRRARPRPRFAACRFDDPRHDPSRWPGPRRRLGTGSTSGGLCPARRGRGVGIRSGRARSDDLAAGTRRRRVRMLPTPPRCPWIEGVAIAAGGAPGSGRGVPGVPRGDGARHADPGRTRTARRRGRRSARRPAGRDARRRPGRAPGRLGGAGAAGSPPSPRRWMTEPPPWPRPRSRRSSTARASTAMPLLETLAGQIAAEPSARAWLLGAGFAPAADRRRRRSTSWPARPTAACSASRGSAPGSGPSGPPGPASATGGSRTVEAGRRPPTSTVDSDQDQ